ncbi:hypothetical protein R1sor_010053 [Riccia sorocarpa]|uniref:Uncharacterized protein n=1 Tax=Riccia sorocarpa TaxID=122646 RepID=A0ABD3HZL8_9MARC
MDNVRNNSGDGDMDGGDAEAEELWRRHVQQNPRVLKSLEGVSPEADLIRKDQGIFFYNMQVHVQFLEMDIMENLVDVTNVQATKPCRIRANFGLDGNTQVSIHGSSRYSTQDTLAQVMFIFGEVLQMRIGWQRF